MLVSGRVTHHRFEPLNRNSRREALSAERRSAERRADAEMMRAKLPFPQRSQGHDVGRDEKIGSTAKKELHVFLFGGRKAVIHCQRVFASLFFC